jgi:membrane protein DedA with SNARE-associated domain
VPLGFGLAYFFTDQLQAIVEDLHRVERWLALLGVTVLVIALTLRVWRKNREVLATGDADDGVL